MGRICITGLGVISAIGNTVAKNRLSLIEGKCGISYLDMLASKFATVLPFGEIKMSNIFLKKKLNSHETGNTRTNLLALHAIEEAIADSRLTQTQVSSNDTALISANTVGGMCMTDEMYYDCKSDAGATEYISSYDFASVNIFLQKRFKLTGIINTINTACSSSANAIMYGARLIKNGLVKRAVVGGVDSLAKFTINGFNALHILSPEPCAPFDENRKGLNLGEGAAFLILEKEEDVADKKVYATISGYCNANDAFHASSLSDEGKGPYHAMKGALQSAGLKPDKIDFINAHGTGTENNDKVESIAMLRLFDNVPAFASTKSNIGHTLGAAGAIEAVYCILSLSEQELYPDLNFKQPIELTKLKPLQEYKKTKLSHIMSNSFGFGGNCTSLIFSTI